MPDCREEVGCVYDRSGSHREEDVVIEREGTEYFKHCDISIVHVLASSFKISTLSDKEIFEKNDSGNFCYLT